MIKGYDGQKIDEEPALNVLAANSSSAIDGDEVFIVGGGVEDDEDIQEEEDVDEAIDDEPVKAILFNEGDSVRGDDAGENESKSDEHLPIVNPGVFWVKHVLLLVFSVPHSHQLLLLVGLFLKFCQYGLVLLLTCQVLHFLLCRHTLHIEGADLLLPKLDSSYSCRIIELDFTLECFH